MDIWPLRAPSWWCATHDWPVRTIQQEAHLSAFRLRGNDDPSTDSLACGCILRSLSQITIRNSLPPGQMTFKSGFQLNTRTSPQWPLDDNTYCAHLGLWQKLYDCSLHLLHNQPMCPKMCVRLTFSTASNCMVGWNLKGGLFDSRVGVRGEVGDRGWTHSIARIWVNISSPLTHWRLAGLGRQNLEQSAYICCHGHYFKEFQEIA